MFDLDRFSSFLVFRLSDCLWMLLFVYARLPKVRSLLQRIPRVCRLSARQVTLWSYSFIPSFYYALVLPLKYLHVGLGTCGFGCSAWGRNLIPFDHPGYIGYAYYCLAMLVDGAWVVIFTWKFESYLIMDNIKVATLIYIWVDWLRHLGNPVLPVFGKSRSTHVIFPMECHLGSKWS